MKVSASSRKAHTLVKRRMFHAREYWHNDNARYGRLLAECLFLQHYMQDDPLTRDRRRIKPKTLKQFGLARHKASILLGSPADFDTHAVQPGADQAKAEVSKRVILNIFKDPLKAYHDSRSRMVWSMLAAERGDIAIEWHQKWGVCFRFADPRRVHLTPGNVFMHSPFNPSVIEEVPMRRSAVRSMIASGWSVPDDLEGDGGEDEFGSDGGDRQADGITRDQAGHLPGGEESDEDDPIVTVCKAWFRDDPFGRDNKRFADATLPEDEWHWVDDTTQERAPFDPTNPTPPQSQSGAPMRFVSSKNEMYGGHEHDDGVLIITAPFYAGDSGPLFEGKWTEGAINPNATLSAFPYMELCSYKHPLRRVGISDTELTHSLVVMDNSGARSNFEQSRMTGALVITRAGGLKDSEGNQYKFKDLPIDLAYTDDMLTQESVKFFQGQGMNPTAIALSQMIDKKWQDIGTGDFSASLGPERSKDIAVGTANLLQQTGDLPTQLHRQDLDLAEAIGARVVLDLCRAYMGDQVVSWVSDEGEAIYATVRGDDLVPLNVTVTATKEWNQQDTDKAQAQAQMLGMLGKLGLPPAVVAILLRKSGMDADVTSAIAEAMAQQPPPGTANGPVPQPGGPPALSVVQGGSPQ